MIKSLLKAVFPRPFLKRLFLVVNKAKIKTVDRLLFPSLHLDAKDFLVYKEVNPFLLLNIDLSSFSDQVRERLKIWVDPKWTQDEYLLRFDRGGFIEAKVGWGITLDRKLIYPSLGFSRAPHVRKPDLFELFLTRKKIVKLDAIISLRDTGEENYFHFFNDLISKLFFIKDNGIDLNNFTVVVSQKLYEKEYFKVTIENSWLKDLTFHVQTDEWIEFKTALFCKPLTHTLKYFKQTVRLLLPENSGNGRRRVFITRDAKTFRFIDNMKELLPVLESYGFEIIDSAKLSFLDQLRIFSECSILIGVHGAGLTNMIFRQGRSLSVVEIANPFEYIPFHYIMLSAQFKYPYTVILGKDNNLKTGGFRLEPNDLEGALNKVCRES